MVLGAISKADPTDSTLEPQIAPGVQFVQIPREAFSAAMAASGAPRDVIWLLDYLFSTVLDGRNAYLTDGVQRALGRPPIDFSEYARRIASAGVWKAAA